MTAEGDKIAFLIREGLVCEHEGQVLLSTRAVALLTGTSEESWTFVGRRAENGATPVTDTFGREIRSGAAEVRARLGTDDPLDVLYALASERRELKRSSDVDDRLRALDD